MKRESLYFHLFCEFLFLSIFCLFYLFGKLLKEGTPYFCWLYFHGVFCVAGADIENMINQAALAAASDGRTSVAMEYLERARDKVLMGPAKKSRVPDDEANLITAYHEGGHTLVAHYTKESMPLHKVTIIPRGPSLGHVSVFPNFTYFYIFTINLVSFLWSFCLLTLF